MNANREDEIALTHFGEKPVIIVKEEKQPAFEKWVQ